MDEYLFFLFFFNGLSPIWDVIQTWYIHPRRSSYMTGKECYFSLSCLNSQLSPYLRNSSPTATEPHTATSSEKAKNAINAIVSIIVYFKILGGASGIEPEKTRLSRSFSTGALTGWVETASRLTTASGEP